MNTDLRLWFAIFVVLATVAMLVKQGEDKELAVDTMMLIPPISGPETWQRCETVGLCKSEYPLNLGPRTNCQDIQICVEIGQ